MLYSYFDCFLPELRESDPSLWKRIIVAYKIILPSVFLGFYIYLYSELCPFVRMEGICNLLLLLIGVENGIAAFSWILCEMISIYSVFLSILQYYILLTQKQDRDLNAMCEQNQEGLLYQFSQFNDIVFIFTAGFNIRIVLPVLAIVLLISVMTCSCSIIVRIFKREGFTQHPRLKSQKFTAHSEPLTCSICLELLKVGEVACKLNCQHWFHHECIEIWYATNATCPNCRTVILDEGIS